MIRVALVVAVASCGRVGFDRLDDGSASTAIATRSATLPTPAAKFSCAWSGSNGEVFCFGGQDSVGRDLAWIVAFDPETDTLRTPLAQLPSPRTYASCAEHTGTHDIYCFGGEVGTAVYLDEIVRYTPATDTAVLATARLPTPRRMFQGCVESSSTHHFYCLGGEDSVGPLTDVIEFDPTADALQILPSVLSTTRRYHACAEDGPTHRIYCFHSAQIDRYTPGGSVTTIASAVDYAERTACVSHPTTGQPLCLGGDDGVTATDHIVALDPSLDIPVVLPFRTPVAVFREGCAADPVHHAVHCLGGDLRNGLTDQIFTFTPP